MKNKPSLMFHLNNRGSLLLISYFVLVVFLGIGATFLIMAVSETQTSERQRLAITAFNIAEAGMERVIYDLRKDMLNNPSNPSWSDGNINGYAVGPDALNYYTFPYPSTELNNGSYTVQLKNEGSEAIYIKSAGTVSGVTQTIQVYAKMIDISPWGNAIFGGAGASGNLINGNVDIRGSVHILGEGLGPTDLAIDIGGTAQLVGNNYSTMPAALKSKVPALPTVNVGGEMVETLYGKLRVKRGKVAVNGSATVGQPNTTGDIYKEFVDGVYINDGWSGNKGAINVYSDNGTSNAYDLGDYVEFPSLSNPHEGYADYSAYLKANSLVLTNQLNNVSSGLSFSYSNANGSIAMDASGNLTISGKVYVDEGNDFILNRDVQYTGSAIIYVSGNVTINNNFVTAGNGSFPNNIIGVMTPNNITFGGSQNDAAGAFYAENSIIATKQYDILGTFVSNFFDMGTNVPAIYQVPELVNHLPDGMIGNDAKAFMIISWQKVAN